MMPISLRTSAPVHDDDEAPELPFRGLQRGLMRGAAHANPELESARLGELELPPQLRHLLGDRELLEGGRVVVEVVGLDLPKRSGERLQRIECLAVDEHVDLRKGGAGHVVGAEVVKLVPDQGAPDPWAAARAFSPGEGPAEARGSRTVKVVIPPAECAVSAPPWARTICREM